MTRYFLSLVLLPFSLLYATFSCCTIVISVIGSLGFLTVTLNDKTPLLSLVCYIITCLYLLVFILGYIFWNDGYSLFSPGVVCSADTSGMRVRKAGRQAGRKGAEETTLFLIFDL